MSEVEVHRPMTLVHPDVIRQEIEAATDPKQLVELHAKADALRKVAGVIDDTGEMAREFTEARIRCERRGGELLALMELPVGGRGKSSHDGRGLASLGIRYNQSSRWQRVAAIPEAEFEAYIADAYRNEKELTTSGLLKLAKQLAASDKPEPTTNGAGLGHHDDGPTATEFPTIVIDPPWRYDNVATRGAAEDHYPTMTQAELLDMEIPAADDAHLYLWVTNSFFEDGFELMRRWGFTYKTCLTWCKPQIGMGNYFRSTTEHVLFGVKGRQPTLRNDVPTHFIADRTKHSAKPESFYDLVESCSPGPYHEMFARRTRFGWSSWGNEMGDVA
jgi:N6-adenosine-specific RNA methylase IME4